MIEEIEALMVHWGEQQHRLGLGGGMGSQMGAIMEWGGCAPRGTPGSRELMGATTGMDYIGNEIGAAVAELMRDKVRGQGLAKLAELRYLHVPASPVREQMRILGIAEGADRTYRNWVERLHLRVLSILTARAGTTRGYVREGGAVEKNLTRASPLRHAV
ncbi:hypothetical protein [Pseudomonas sp. Irchel s3h14]|uniref:hypothetical protein n=1 Tax=Pseudomonas sp. Irchel s3h14 TaxID=2009179 RepID=UPI000BA3F3CA|nr:hypothetical protein [Pseudomonas sp. Irchel s3h14]